MNSLVKTQKTYFFNYFSTFFICKNTNEMILLIKNDTGNRFLGVLIRKELLRFILTKVVGEPIMIVERERKMRVTKNDLSFNKVELDYQALRETALYAFALLRQSVLTSCAKLSEPSVCVHANASLPLEARRLADNAKHLAVVAETLHALKHGMTRKNKELVNL